MLYSIATPEKIKECMEAVQELFWPTGEFTPQKLMDQFDANDLWKKIPEQRQITEEELLKLFVDKMHNYAEIVGDKPLYHSLSTNSNFEFPFIDRYYKYIFKRKWDQVSLNLGEMTRCYASITPLEDGKNCSKSQGDIVTSSTWSPQPRS